MEYCCVYLRRDESGCYRWYIEYHECGDGYHEAWLVFWEEPLGRKDKVAECIERYGQAAHVYVPRGRVDEDWVRKALGRLDRAFMAIGWRDATAKYGELVRSHKTWCYCFEARSGEDIDDERPEVEALARVYVSWGENNVR